MSARHAIAPLVVAVALTACTGAPEAAETPEPTGSPAPTATESESPSATPTPSPSASEDDLYAAPAPEDVDVEYVQRVLEGIYAVEDHVLLLEIGHALNGGTEPTDSMYRMLETAFAGEKLEFERRDVADDFEERSPLDTYKRNPGPVEIKVDEVVDAGIDCIIATYIYDGSARLKEPRSPLGPLIGLLEPKESERDPENINPTPWVVTRQGTVESLSGDPTCAS